MIDVTITDQNNEVVGRINGLPERLDEIKLSQFASFQAAFDHREEWLKEYGEKSILSHDFAIKYLEWTVDLINEFTTSDAGTTLFNDEQWKEHLLKMSKGKEFDYKALEGSLFSVLAHIYKLVTSFKPKHDYTRTYRFEHEGESFYLDPADRNFITKKLSFTGIEAARVIEGLKMHDSYQRSKANDKKGNFFFTSLLYAIASFARKEGEKFPDIQSEIDTFVARRVLLFQNLDMKTGIEVSAFFLSTSDWLNRIQSKDTFGMLQLGLLQRLKKSKQELSQEN